LYAQSDFATVGDKNFFKHKWGNALSARVSVPWFGSDDLALCEVNQ
jgi:hypothetical protein